MSRTTEHQQCPYDLVPPIAGCWVGLSLPGGVGWGQFPSVKALGNTKGRHEGGL
jgi:hypothetical protein